MSNIYLDITFRQETKKDFRFMLQTSNSVFTIQIQAQTSPNQRVYHALKFFKINFAKAHMLQKSISNAKNRRDDYFFCYNDDGLI